MVLFGFMPYSMRGNKKWYVYEISSVQYDIHDMSCHLILRRNKFWQKHNGENVTYHCIALNPDGSMDRGKSITKPSCVPGFLRVWNHAKEKNNDLLFQPSAQLLHVIFAVFCADGDQVQTPPKHLHTLLNLTLNCSQWQKHKAQQGLTIM